MFGASSQQFHDNGFWIEAIHAGGDTREAALGELRLILLRGLRRSFPDGVRNNAWSLEDATQETLIRVTERIRSFRGDSRFTTWAMSIAVRVALGETRRARWKDVSLEEMADAGRLEPLDNSSAVNKEDQLGYQQLTRLLRSTLQSGLTEKQRLAIEAELGGTPPDEIARRMGTTRNAVYKLVYDAREKLRAEILGTGWTETQIRSLLEAADR